MDQRSRSERSSGRILKFFAVTVGIGLGLNLGPIPASAFVAMPYGTYPINQWPMPQPYFGPYSTNLNFYGTPWGQVPPAYFYPSLTPFLGIPPANYFMPHYPSPYGPGNYCPTCNPFTPPSIIPQPNQPHSPFVS